MAWARICWLYWCTHAEPLRLKWWKYPIKSSVGMKSRGREILERQPITVFTTKQKYMTQCFVTQCDSFTHGDVKINKSERYYPSYCQRCNETGQDFQNVLKIADIYLFFFVQQFKRVIWLHTCAPAKCYWQKLKLCGLKDCAYGWFSCQRAPQVPAQHHILLSCTCTDKRSIQSDNLNDSAISLPMTSSSAPPTAWQIGQQPPNTRLCR